MYKRDSALKAYNSWSAIKPHQSTKVLMRMGTSDHHQCVCSYLVLWSDCCNVLRVGHARNIWDHRQDIRLLKANEEATK